MCSSAHVLSAEENITEFEDMTQGLQLAKKFGKIDGALATLGALKDTS